MRTLFKLDSQAVRYWCQDESRFGLHTLTRRRITSKGVRPVGNVQLKFEYYWLYGMIEPATGDSFFLEMSHVDRICFQTFLHEFSTQFPDDLNIIQVDQAGFHTAKKLQIPENVLLLFQPPYSPQINPMETFWKVLKDDLAWHNYSEIETLKEHVAGKLKQYSKQQIASITHRNFILNAVENRNSS